MEQNKHKVSIPDNAYRELKAGEEYEPIMSADSSGSRSAKCSKPPSPSP